jgi:hypothetical protein
MSAADAKSAEKEAKQQIKDSQKAASQTATTMKPSS